MVTLSNGRKLYFRGVSISHIEGLSPLVSVHNDETTGSQWAKKARRIGDHVFIDCMNTPLQPKSNWFVMLHIDKIPHPIQKLLGI